MTRATPRRPTSPPIASRSWRGCARSPSSSDRSSGDELEARLLAEIDAAAAAYDAGDVEAGRTLATEVERTLATEVAGEAGCHDRVLRC